MFTFISQDFCSSLGMKKKSSKYVSQDSFLQQLLVKYNLK